jgi:hypothetical protein
MPMGFWMTKRRISIGGLIVLMIAIGVWVALPKHSASSVTGASEPVAKSKIHEAKSPPPTPSVRPISVSSVWVRPSAKVAARQSRRQGFAWILRQLGASETLLDRLADGDVVAVLSELKAQAGAGDPAAVNILGEIAYQNCYLGGSTEVLDDYEASQVADAKALAPADAEWLTDALHRDVAFDKQLTSACAQMIDVNQAFDWVAARAKQGDGASSWLLYRAAGSMTEMQQHIREAAAAGFSEAQFEFTLFAKDQHVTDINGLELTTGDLLRQSAEKLPRSEGALALCEYSGCDGVAIDTPSAVAHAREAAQRGSIDALIQIGPHLPAGQIDPNDVSAWSLINASLQQQGCGGNGLNVASMKSTTAMLTSINITPEAHALADRYWERYGSQILSNRGCGS